MGATLPSADDIRVIVREELARALAPKGPEWLGIEEAAERTGLSVSTVRRMVRDRQLRATKMRGRVRIEAASLPQPEAEVVDLAARARAR